MPDAHPDDLTLADYVDGLLDDVFSRRVRDHLEFCAACRRAAATISAVQLPDLPPLDAADLPAAPAQVRAAVAAGRTASFEPGQLWRVAWQNQALLVAIAGTPTSDARVPVVATDAVDSDTDDGRAVEIPAARTQLGFRVRWHPAVRASLPGFVFDVLLAELAPPPQLPEDANQLHPLDPARLSDDALAAQLSWFESATWLPERSQATQTIATLADRAGLSARRVAEDLDVPLPRAVQVLRGAAEPTVQERIGLARLLGVPADEIGLDFSALPDDLIRHLSDPALRPRMRARARRQNIDEAAAMRQVAVTALRPAARRAGRADADLDWRQVIGDILAGEEP